MKMLVTNFKQFKCFVFYICECVCVCMEYLYPTFTPVY